MATTYTDNNISQLIINKLTKTEYEALMPDPEQLYLLPETVSDTVTEDDTNPVSGGAVFDALTNSFPSQIQWGFIATLQNTSSSNDATTTFTVNKAGFFQLIIQGTTGGDCVARINYPEGSPYNGTSACSATMLNGYGVGNQCYLLPGTYTLFLSKVTVPATANVIKLMDNSAS